jgi:hypothetical protein
VTAHAAQSVVMPAINAASALESYRRDERVRPDAAATPTAQRTSAVTHTFGHGSGST